MPDASGAGEPGRELVPLPKPEDPEVLEPDPGPGLVDLVTRSAKVGLDAVGLAAGDVMNASVRFARAVGVAADAGVVVSVAALTPGSLPRTGLRPGRSASWRWTRR